MPGLLVVKNNQQIEEEYRDRMGFNINSGRLNDRLATHIRDAWERNKRAKLEIEKRMLKSLRQRNGIYEPEKLAVIRKTEGSEVYMMLTSMKCRAAEAWLSDYYSPVRDKPWSIKPTPQPDLPPYMSDMLKNEVMNRILTAAYLYSQDAGMPVTPDEFNKVANAHYYEMEDMLRISINGEAKRAAERMTIKIADQMAEGGWEKSFREVRSDIVTFGTGIIKGPVVRRKKDYKWIRKYSGDWEMDIVDLLALEYDRVSPLDFYPAGDAIDICDGDLIERQLLSRQELNKFIGVSGYNEANLRKALREVDSTFGQKEMLPVDIQRASAEGRSVQSVNDSGKIELLNYWGSVQGKVLLEYGMDRREIPDPELDYEINAKYITHGEGYVIRVIINKTGERPYSKGGFEEVPGAYWYKSLPELMADIQDMCNSSARAINNNEAIASGPQVEVNVNKIMNGASSNKIWPWKIWQTEDETGNGNPVVRFYQPQSIVHELLAVYEKFSREADEKSGIPAYAHGDPKVGGAGNTSSGLSMFISMAGKIISELIGRIDFDIISPPVRRTYHHNMTYEPDKSIKGDAKVVVKGISSLMAKEQSQVRRNEFLDRTNNPVDLQITGVEGRKEVLKESVRMLDMDVEKVIPEGATPFISADLKGRAPSPQPETLDVAGNRSGGVDANQFKSVSQKGTM